MIDEPSFLHLSSSPLRILILWTHFSFLSSRPIYLPLHSCGQVILFRGLKLVVCKTATSGIWLVTFHFENWPFVSRETDFRNNTIPRTSSVKAGLVFQKKTKNPNSRRNLVLSLVTKLLLLFILLPQMRWLNYLQRGHAVARWHFQN